ncbi:unnamed protein product, partial [Timema podura]|nr:unnamed protein product [Timema podura]
IEDDDEEEDSEKWKGKNPLTDVITQLIETNPPPGVIPVSELEPQAIIIFGKILPVEGNPKLQQAIASGSEALSKLIQSGQLEELHDVMPHSDEHNHDTYINDEMDIDSESEGLPDPLSSSAYSHISSKERRRKSRFNDPNDHSRNMILDGGHNMMPMDGQDKDMRSIAMMRQQFPPNSVPDQDMRFSTGDMDLRQPPMMPMGDQDFRRLHINNNIRHDITMDEDLRGYGMDQPRFDDCDARHFGDQDLRGNPNSQHQQNMMEMGDVDFRHNPQGNHQNMLNMNPLSVRPDQNSPNQGPNMGMGPPSNKDIDARRHGFGPESATMQNIDDNVDSSGGRKVLLNTPQQFTGGPLPRGMMDQNHWRGGPPNDQWAGNMPDQEGIKDIDNPNLRWGSRGSPRGTGGHYNDRGRGRNFGPEGPNRGEPRGNFGPDGLGSIEHGRGEPRGNFGPDGPVRGEPRGNFGLDGSGRGKLRGNFGLDGPDNMERGGEEVRGNFGPDGRSRGEPRGNFGPDGPGRGEPRGNFGPDGPGRGEPRGNFGPDELGRRESRGNFGLDELGSMGYGRGEPRGNFGPSGNFHPQDNFGQGRHMDENLLVPNFSPSENFGPGGNFGHGNFGPGGNFGPEDNFGPGNNFGPGDNFGPEENFDHGRNMKEGSNFEPQEEGELGSDREEGYAESEGRDGHWGGGSNFSERGGRFSSFRRGSRSRGFPRSRGDRGSRSGGRSRTRGKFRGRGRGGDTS